MTISILVLRGVVGPSSRDTQVVLLLAELLVEVAEAHACKVSCHVPPALSFALCQEKLAMMQVQELKGLRM